MRVSAGRGKKREFLNNCSHANLMRDKHVERALHLHSNFGKKFPRTGREHGLTESERWSTIRKLQTVFVDLACMCCRV